jgi:hypothetical protein
MKPEGFANARTARNYFEKALVNQANRLCSLPNIPSEMLCTITADDVESIKLL